jgi:hypothetical protein
MVTKRDARLRHATSYAERLEAACANLADGEANEAHADVDQIWAQLHAAIDWLSGLAAEADDAARILSRVCDAGIEFLPSKLAARDRIPLLMAACDGATRVDNEGMLAGHLANLGVALTDVGDDAAALDCHERAQVIARSHGTGPGKRRTPRKSRTSVRASATRDGRCSTRRTR